MWVSGCESRLDKVPWLYEGRMYMRFPLTAFLTSLVAVGGYAHGGTAMIPSSGDSRAVTGVDSGSGAVSGPQFQTLYSDDSQLFFPVSPQPQIASPSSNASVPQSAAVMMDQVASESPVEPIPSPSA